MTDLFKVVNILNRFSGKGQFPLQLLDLGLHVGHVPAHGVPDAADQPVVDLLQPLINKERGFSVTS